MKTIMAVFFFITVSSAAYADTPTWYKGDERCPPPPVSDIYSAPYNALDHPLDEPDFADAEKPGWFCSYQKDDGTTVQFGDSRTPREQWLSVWGRNNSD